MDFSYINVTDTIVYQDSFIECTDNLSSSLTNLDSVDYYTFGIPSEMEGGIFSDMEVFKQLDIARWRGEVRQVEVFFSIIRKLQCN